MTSLSQHTSFQTREDVGLTLVVYLLSQVQLFVNPWIAACQSPLSSTISQSLLKLMSIQPSHPLCPLLLLTSIFPSLRVFSYESALCIMWPKYWSFNFSISPSNENSVFISFRIDWFDLLAAQGTLKSLRILSCSTNDM